LSEDGLDFLLREFKDSWDHKWLDESNKAIFVSSSSVKVSLGLKLSEEDDSRGSGTERAGASGIRVVSEKDFVFSRCVWNMSVSVEGIGFSTEESNDKFVISDEFLKSIAIDSSGWWTRLLDNVVHDGVLGSSSLVVTWVSSLEEFEGWEPFDSESLAELFVLGGVDLGDAERWVSGSQLLGGGSILRGKLLAMTAPWSIEFNQQVFVFSKLFIEVCVGEDEDTLIQLSGNYLVEGRGGENEK
jgi:hypothetical protein